MARQLEEVKHHERREDGERVAERHGEVLRGISDGRHGRRSRRDTLRRIREQHERTPDKDDGDRLPKSRAPAINDATAMDWTPMKGMSTHATVNHIVAIGLPPRCWAY